MLFYVFFFFKQKTAYELRISDWSSDVCSSDLFAQFGLAAQPRDELAQVLCLNRQCKRAVAFQHRFGGEAARLLPVLLFGAGEKAAAAVQSRAGGGKPATGFGRAVALRPQQAARLSESGRRSRGGGVRERG